MGFINQLLPKKFLGVLPLYIGVELILFYGIINKMSGFYGLLSLFTGHPINIFQWLFYLTSFIFLIFYITGFRNVRNPNINQMSLVTSLYLLDTLVGLFFTLYFVWLWLSEQEDASSGTGGAISDYSADTAGSTKRPIVKTAQVEQGSSPLLLKARDVALSSVTPELIMRAADAASQSATESYEMFWIVALTVGTTAVRLYFTLIILSFFNELVLASKFNSRYRLNTSVTSSNTFISVLNKIEIKAYHMLASLCS